MANVYAVKSGNWSDVTTWNTGALPTSADAVYSNNFTVTIDGTFVVQSINYASATGIAAGGGFTLNSGADLTASVTTNGGSGTSLGYLVGFSSASPATATLRGNVTVNTTVRDGRSAVRNSGSGTLTIVGSVNVSSQYLDHGVINSSTGTINIIGNVTRQQDSNGSGTGVWNSSSGTINITGNITGNNSASSADRTACYNTSNGTINITGDVYGGNVGSVYNNSTGAVTITGTIGGSGYALTNASSGTATHIGTVYASASAYAITRGSVSQNTFLTGPFIGTAQGVVANLALSWRWIASVGSSYMTAVTSGVGGTATGYKNLYTADSPLSNSGQPAVSNVRSGIIYGPNSELTGTMIVPSANTVIAGVSVGNTIGTAQFASPADFWNVAISGITTSGSIGERLKNSATVSSVANIISNALR